MTQVRYKEWCKWGDKKIGNKKEYDYGIAIMRILMSLVVVFTHFSQNTNDKVSIITKIMLIFSKCAVPFFVITSFYYLYNDLDNRAEEKLKKRMLRLLNPQLTWSLIYFGLIKFFELFYKSTETITLSDFVLQIFGGHKFNKAMWFQIDMIVITLIIILLFLGLRRHIIQIIGTVLIISILLEYIGLNYALWNTTPESFMYTFGRILEMIPCACVGIIYRSIGKKHGRKKKWWMSALAIILTIVLYPVIKIDQKLCLGFGYSGLVVLLMGFLIFYASINFAPKINYKIKKIIISSSSLTMGIYCIHMLIGNYIVINLKQYLSSETYCILIWCVSYTIILVLSRVFRNSHIRETLI